ncbi:MAG: EAL domain-containing protein [Candidatus Thiodiazotropha sp. (ex. Lucinisca nassula)]|nr:EAL domain-containing protein [Candidatus Thiodiazotropha sp. (ex. Lucinisca nassula)]MBW9272445.1 EAL domain-containing protein [Candidatus Thiodiazotropha sp. (ex. Lucinisca nassula)]
MPVGSLWRLYFFLILCSLLLYFVAGKVTSDNIQQNAIKDISHIHKLVEISSINQLHQLDTLLKTLGRRLYDIGLDNGGALKNAMDELIADNQSITAYGISTPDGKMIHNSLNLDNERLPNLLQTPETRETYLKALYSDGMVLGRTYFYDPLKQWIIPFRYALRDPQGTPLAVISLAIDVENENNPWAIGRKAEGFAVSITKQNADNDSYYSQYAYPDSFLPLGNKYKTYYSPPYPENEIVLAKQRIAESAGMNMERFMAREMPVHYIFSADTDWLEVISYNNRYELFTAISKEYRYINYSIYIAYVKYFFLFLLFNTVLFFIIRYIDKIQNISRVTLKHQASHDKLTNLPNRYYLDDQFHKWIKVSNKSSYSVIFLDMNNFKYINEYYGHSIGDRVLQILARRLQNCTTDNTLAVRQGGDEFIILVPHSDVAQLKTFSEHISNKFREKIVVDGIMLSLSGSMGIATSNQPGHPLEDLMKKADIAMHSAKNEHADYAFFTEELQQINDERTLIQEAMQQALDNDEMYMVYQPQVHAIDGQLHGVEALIRWTNPSLGTISPTDFIPLAEGSKLINNIGDFVIDTVFREISHIQSISKPFQISINVSVRQLRDVNLRRYLVDKANEYDIKPSNVTLEITENVFIDDFDQIQHILMQIKREGFKVSLDDFGTGYSSLSVLDKLPIDEIKIDRSFIQHIDSADNYNSFVESIVRIGHSLSIPTLAEGVENEEQVLSITACGCDLIQGYLFAKPMKKDQLEAYILDFNPYGRLVNNARTE